MDLHRRSAAVCALSGHPTVIDVVRVASTLTGSFVEVVVFEADRAMVVGSLNSGLLQPRPLTTAESILAKGGQRTEILEALVVGGVGDRHVPPAWGHREVSTS